MKPQSCPSRGSPQPSIPPALLHGVATTARAFKPLRPLIALAVLLSLTRGTLHAQQAQGQGYPQYPQSAPYAGQYLPNQQSGYAQQQPYAQQSYPGSNQAPSGQAYAGDPLPDYGQPQPPAQPLTAAQLEQLLAPIALYPDTLVAQVLAAATYPAQVVGADHWLQSQGYASPDQIVAGADAQSWDPSVKALTAFPQVLAQMDHNLQWTTDLGNAYYNQPQDVLQTVQVLRQRAQAAGTLQDTPQEAVSYNQSYIQLAPVNPQVVYVPAYNPWDVYGQPVTPYHGFSLLNSLASLAGSSPINYGLGIAMSAFSHTPFGWAAWALNWLTQSVLFNQSNYQSNSATVAHWAFPSNGQRQRAEMPRQPAAYDRPQTSYARPATEFSRQAFARQSVRNPESYAANRPEEHFNHDYPAQPRNYARPTQQVYNDHQPPAPLTARQQAYTRPGYASGFYGGSPQTYASRPATTYSSPQQSWRAPNSTASGPTAQRGESSQRSYLSDRAYSPSSGHSFEESSSRQAHSGGFHLFGGHSAEKSYGGGHAPKSYSSKSFSKGHSGGGGHSGSNHSGGHHHD